MARYEYLPTRISAVMVGAFISSVVIYIIVTHVEIYYRNRSLSNAIRASLNRNVLAGLYRFVPSSLIRPRFNRKACQEATECPVNLTPNN